MERALDAAIVDDLASYSKICPHVSTVSVQCVYFAFSVPEDDDIVASHLYGLGFMVFELFAFAGNEPAVGVGRESLTHIFF